MLRSIFIFSLLAVFAIAAAFALPFGSAKTSKSILSMWKAAKPRSS